MQGFDIATDSQMMVGAVGGGLRKGGTILPHGLMADFRPWVWKNANIRAEKLLWDKNGNVYIFEGSTRYAVMKYAQNGATPIWTYRVPGTVNITIYDYLVDSDGNMYIADNDWYLRKLDTSLNVLWEKYLGFRRVVRRMFFDSYGKVFIYQEDQSDGKRYFTRVDPANGNILFEKEITVIGSYTFSLVYLDKDNIYAAYGADIYKFDVNFNLLWNTSHLSYILKDSTGVRGIGIDGDGNVYCVNTRQIFKRTSTGIVSANLYSYLEDVADGSTTIKREYMGIAVMPAGGVYAVYNYGDTTKTAIRSFSPNLELTGEMVLNDQKVSGLLLKDKQLWTIGVSGFGRHAMQYKLI